MRTRAANRDAPVFPTKKTFMRLVPPSAPKGKFISNNSVTRKRKNDTLGLRNGRMVKENADFPA